MSVVKKKKTAAPKASSFVTDTIANNFKNWTVPYQLTVFCLHRSTTYLIPFSNIVGNKDLNRAPNKKQAWCLEVK
jgi:hypothetical protein